MDIQRKQSTRVRKLRRILYVFVAIGILVTITVGLSRLKPADPTVERGTVWVDTVKRGTMIRQVRGLGTLVPEDIRIIPATTEGIVERILIRPGTPVNPNDILIELSNPELQQTALDAELQVKGAEADYANLKVKLDSQLLDQKAGSATVQADYHQAKLQAEANEELYKKGLLSDLTLKLSKSKAEELAIRFDIEQKRTAISKEAIDAQLSAQQSRIDQLRALANLRHEQIASLKIRAGNSGVLQLMTAEVGQRVTIGTNLARVADQKKLKAELKIPETQAKDVILGQKATIDTRNGVIEGHVVRIDPSVLQGTVTVDIALEGDLPQGARPDLSVDGTIELENLSEVLYVGRPVHGQTNTTIGLFKLEDGGKTAVRIQVKLGRTSVNTVEIIDGLKEGDQVILSDTAAWDAFNRVRLN